MNGFARRRDGVHLELRPLEVELMRHLLGQLADLVRPEAPAEDADPLAVALGIGERTAEPDDPALARLLPSAYRDDHEAAGEFRRYTERDLRGRKVADAERALATLDGLPARLADDAVRSWLGALNDLRLTLGTRLDVSDDPEDDLRHLDDDDPRLASLEVYDWLGWLQEGLVRALARDLPRGGGPGRR